MQKQSRIHVFGASGSGTTTLAAALASEVGVLHLDVDDFYWKPSDPPYRVKNKPEQRVTAIQTAIGEERSWVLSGSLVSWGGSLVGDFTHAVFLELDPAERMKRLRAREQDRHGERIAPGGDMHDDHLAFMAWAQAYDTATGGLRCRRVHENWMQGLACPTTVLDSSRSVSMLVRECIGRL